MVKAKFSLDRRTDEQTDRQTGWFLYTPPKLRLRGYKKWQHSEECSFHMPNIAMRDYQESVTTRQTDADKKEIKIPVHYVEYRQYFTKL